MLLCAFKNKISASQFVPITALGGEKPEISANGRPESIRKIDAINVQNQRPTLICKRNNHSLVALLFAGVILLLPFATLGQVTTGDIVGNVTDPTGASVPNATITVVNTDSHFTRTVTSGTSGEYAVNLVPI